MKEKNKYFIYPGILFTSFILYTILICTIDIQEIGPESSSVGFATINNFFHNLFSYNDIWYYITKYLGIIPFLLVGFYGLCGLIQLIKRKSLLKVDKRLLFLGVLYVLLGITYILFEKIIINYRPLLMDGELEASYPSSHTMLAVTICLSSLLVAKYYIKDKTILKAINIGTILLMVLLVVGRLLSGVHWFTDIIGGIIISLTLVSLYYSFIKD